MKKNSVLHTVSKICFVFFAVLYALLQTAFFITDENKRVISRELGQSTYELIENTDSAEDTDYFKSDYDSIASLTADGAALVEEVEAGGAVLLKNENGCLPLDPAVEGRVSLFGVACVDPAYGGSGSAASSNPADPTDVKEGLEHAGLSVNTRLYGFYSDNKGKYAASGLKINDAPWKEITAARGVSESFADYGDAAIFMIKRVRGESGDLPFDESSCDGENGNYLALNANERSVLAGIAALKGEVFQKILVLFNTPNQVEAEFLNDPAYKIDAALWIGSVGQTGLDAVGKILTGEVNPSGRLADTFWARHAYNPAMANFGSVKYANVEAYAGQLPAETGSSYTGLRYTDYVVYQEGVYVGYRYAETRYFDAVTERANVGAFDYAQAVAFPFGHGLSYTTFSYSDFDLSYDGAKDEYTVRVTVENTGAKPGREVVQLYIQKPYTDYDRRHGVEKPAVELADYTKTEELAVGERVTCTLTVDGRALASYDANGAGTYILDEGNYFFTVAANAHEATDNILASLGRTTADGMTSDGDPSLVKSVKKTFDDSTYAAENGNRIGNLFDDGDINRYPNAGENSVRYLSRDDWAGTTPDGRVALSLNQGMVDDILAQNGDSRIEPDDRAYPNYEEDAGLSLVDLRVDDTGTPIDFDEAIWDEFMDQLSWSDICELVTTGLRKTGGNERVTKPETVEHNGPTGITQQYKFGESGLATKMGDPDAAISPPYYPCIGILAASFDKELARRVGTMLGEDALWAGYSGFYGVGVNVHRSAYDGRAFEYYSEDPCLSGEQAARLAAGVQSKGCNAYVKHIAGYEQQHNRVGLNVWCNEQAYREIYLKPFKTVIQKGGAMNVMAAYSRIGVTLCPASKALCTDFLRGECGLKGFVVSDMWTGRYLDSQLINCMMAGCDLPDGDLKGVSIYEKYQSGYGGVAWQMRLAAKRILFATVRSNAMNGYSSDTRMRQIMPAWQAALVGGTIASGVLFALSCGALVATALIARSKKSIEK